MKMQRLKGIIAVITMLAVLISVIPMAFADTAYSKFTDFPTGWSAAAMEHAVDNGLLNGRSETTINPQGNLTRAEMATIINRAFGATKKADISKYTDVPADAWYYEEIAKAVNMRTFIGDSSSTMAPEANITREAVFTAIARALVLETEDYSALNKHPDGAQVSDWAKSATAVLVSKGYIQGNENGMLTPQKNITREEFAQMMYNIIKTYYTSAGKVNYTGADSSLIRTGGVSLENVTIEGDLIIGDGVGNGTVVLQSVTIKGRLLCRAGTIKIINSKVGEYVVVYNVNGTVHFDNYNTELVFKDMKMYTPATFRKRTGAVVGTTTPEYYTVSFHNGADPTAFTTVSVDKSYPEANRTLLYLNQSLNSIYSAYIGATLPAYNRNQLSHTTAATTEYTHEVKKEYIYEKTPGVWEVFTEETVIDRDIDVYYAAKRLAVETDITTPMIGMPYVLEIRYDSKSRLADSFKDALISTGATLNQTAAKNKINEKIVELYSKINAETGIVDVNGNILDKDYGLKIVDVIDYDQIEAEVNAYIDGILNGTEEEIKRFVALLDIEALVIQIGGKNLINTLIGNATARNLLIDKLGARNEFIVKILENGAYNSEILNLLKTGSNKADLLAYLDSKSAIKKEVLDTIKVNDSFAAALENAALMAIISDEVKANAEFKNILTTEGGYKAEIIAAIKNDTDNIEEIVTKLTGDADFRKKLVKELAYPLESADTAGTQAKETKDAILEIIRTDYADTDYETAIVDTPRGYEAIVAQYVDGTGRNWGVGFTTQQFATYAAKIDSVIQSVVKDYFAYNAEDASMTKPNGYDMIKNYIDTRIDTVISDVLTDYANGVYDSSGEGTSKAQIKAFIDGELPGQIKKALEDYINPEVTMNATLEGVIDNSLIAFVKRYINGDTTLNNDIVPVIEENIIAFMISYFKGNTTLGTDVDILRLIDTVKSEFVSKIKAAANENTETLQNVVNTYITPMSDQEVNNLIVEFADAEIIAAYIYGLSADEKVELKTTINSFLAGYDPYLDFMLAFKNKASEFEVNKGNTHFVKAVGEAIYGFDFDRILEILKAKGFEPMINFLGEEVISDIFAASKADYWNGLSPIITEVENSTDENIKRYYTTSMNVTINVPLILHGIYNNYSARFKAKIEANEIYDYDQNTALKKLVNLDWFGMMIGYDNARIDEAAGITGYYFKGYMDYYCALLDTIILYDDALCFYDTTNYDDEALKDVKKSLTKEVLELLDDLQSISDKIANGQPIAGSYTLQDLVNKVDQLESAAASMGGAINVSAVVDPVKEILTNLGVGNLPGGYTLDDLSILSAKLKAVINGMNESQYDSINATFEELISSAMQRIGAIFTEIDQNGTLNGTPIDELMSRISMLGTIYNNYSVQIKKVISALADADFGSVDFDINAEEYEDIIFGRELDNIFNVDSILDAVKGKLGTSEKTGYDSVSQQYFIDKYSKTADGNTFSIERKFY